MQGSAEDFERLRGHSCDMCVGSSIDLHFSMMEWSEEDIIMDVGCGPGRTTKNILLPRCPKFKKILAIDVNPDYIQYAKENYSHERIEYKIRDILQSADAKEFGKYDKIVAFLVFHFTHDYEKLFTVISSLLKPGGYFLFVYLTKFPIYPLLHELSFHEEWKKYVKTEDILALTPPAEYWKNTEKEFQNFVSKFGLRVTKSKCEVLDFEFSNAQHISDFYFALVPKIFFKNVDPETKARLWKLAGPIILKSCKRKEDGRIFPSCEMLQVSGMKMSKESPTSH